MTLQETINKLEAKIVDLDTAELIYPVASEIVSRQINRLFEDGEGAQGSLGKYSTDSNYYTKKQFKNKGAFKAKGKTGKTKFKDKTPHKSMYLDKGYKELKQIQGYESGFVNLQYSKDLRTDYTTGLQIKGDKVIMKLKRKINTDKTDWLSKKYGEKTFALTDAEKTFYRKEVSKELVNYFSN